MIPGTSTDLKRDLSASNVKAELPTELDGSHQSKLDEVKGESGKDFSSDFDAGQGAQGRRVAVRAHANDGDNADLKNWPGKALPALKHHLKIDQNLDKSK
jgi:putative membrane protein